MNYAEALKILGELYEYTAWASEDAEWFEVYVQGALNHGTLLPINLPYDSALKRGQMARLAAGYRAEHEGELDLYRAFESGREVVSSSSVSSSSSSVSSSSSAVSSAESSSSSSSSTNLAGRPFELPATKHFLLVGERGPAIADAMFFPISGNVQLRSIEVTILDEEVYSLESLYLRNYLGEHMSELQLDYRDDSDRTWIAEFGTGKYILPERTGTILALEAELRIKNKGGISNERFRIKNMRLTVQPVGGANSFNLIGGSAHYPYQRTALGRITSVENVVSGTGTTIQEGDSRLLAEFSFTAEAVDDSFVHLEWLDFDVEANGVDVSDWELELSGVAQHITCSEDDDTVHCFNIPEDDGLVGIEPRTVKLYGDVYTEGTGDHTLQIELDTGTDDDGGGIHWTDGTGNFNWVESDKESIKSPVMTVE